MKDILNFLIDTGKLKNVKRRGISFYGVKNPDSATDHAYRMAMMVWVLGKEKKINIERAFKIALIHDICKVITGDITPYDGLLPKDKKKKHKFVRNWRRLLLNEKGERHAKKLEKESKALEKLILKMPPKIKREIYGIWMDYQKGRSSEARFVYQLDMIENLLEALESYKKDKKFPTRPWWQHAEEVVDDPVLLEFLKEIGKEELKTK